MMVDIAVAVAARLRDPSSPWVLVMAVMGVESNLEVLEWEGEGEDAHMNATGQSSVCGLDGRIANAREDDGPID
jgi:hypothetical protein